MTSDCSFEFGYDDTIAVAAPRDITANPRRAWRLTAVSNSC
jgi:hypothetical protein